MRDIPNWMLLAALGLGGWWLANRFNQTRKEIAQAVVSNTADAYDSIFRPGLTKEGFSQPVKVARLQNGTCPPGYEPRTDRNGVPYCLQTGQNTRRDVSTGLPVAVGIPTGKMGGLH